MEDVTRAVLYAILEVLWLAFAPLVLAIAVGKFLTAPKVSPT